MNAHPLVGGGLASIGERTWTLALENPYTRLTNGLPVTTFPSGSIDEAESRSGEARALLDQLASIKVEDLGGAELDTHGFLREELSRMQREGEAWWFASPVAPYSALMVGHYVIQILRPITVASTDDLDRWAGLWSDLARLIRTLRVRLERQAAAGRRLARPAIEFALQSLRGQRESLAAHLGESEATAAAVDPAWRASWRNHCERLREREVLPAMDALIEALSAPDYAIAASEACGLMHWPGGEEEYRHLIASHLTLPVPPERLHRTGLEQVSELTERLCALRSRIGFAGDEKAFAASLRGNPSAFARTPEEVEQRYLRLMKRMDAALPAWFSHLPRSPYRVQRLLPEQEAGMTYGYYEKPHAVGEPGSYRFSAADLENRSQLQAAALIFHELAPGHHFHLARQMELDHLPQIRRAALGLTVFNEGWAEYASGLAGEMGLYDDPYDHYGRLIQERFTAQRLVVDTGLNAFGWTLERARAYMRENTLEGEAQIVSETLRYSTDWPAQALAYRFGYLEFMRLREDARARVGSAFDIRDFHEAVLGQGALPLAVLRGQLERALPAVA